MSAAHAFNYASAAVAIVAAALWGESAWLRIPSSAQAYVDISQSSVDGSIGGSGFDDFTELAAALRRQGWWSAAAAGCSALAASLMAIGVYLGA